MFPCGVVLQENVMIAEVCGSDISAEQARLKEAKTNKKKKTPSQEVTQSQKTTWNIESHFVLMWTRFHKMQ